MPVLLQICIVAATIAFIAVAIAVVRALNRLSKTAEHLNTTIPMIQKSIDQIDKIAGEAHEVVAAFSDIAPTLRKTANLVENVGARAADLSHALLDEVESPVRGAVGLVRGIRAGANVLLHRRAKRHHGDGESSPPHGEFDDE
jgi:uncharacterized protein YoxC